jgi:hypothetical protein
MMMMKEELSKPFLASSSPSLPRSPPLSTTSIPHPILHLHTSSISAGVTLDERRPQVRLVPYPSSTIRLLDSGLRESGVSDLLHPLMHHTEGRKEKKGKKEKKAAVVHRAVPGRP